MPFISVNLRISAAKQSPQAHTIFSRRYTRMHTVQALPQNTALVYSLDPISVNLRKSAANSTLTSLPSLREAVFDFKLLRVPRPASRVPIVSQGKQSPLLRQHQLGCTQGPPSWQPGSAGSTERFRVTHQRKRPTEL